MKDEPYRMSQVMTANPITVSPWERLWDARRKMKTHGVRYLPVAVEGDVVGIIRDRDLRLERHYRHPEELRVFDLMEEDVWCLKPDDPVSEAVNAMLDFRYEYVLVTTGRRTLEGIFTRHDALRFTTRARPAA